MIDAIYQILSSFGYTHPLHPTITHLTIGMAMGAFLFALGASVLQKPDLFQTARHCSVLALIAAIPTAILGLMDWQHFYAGSFLFPIQMKMVLATVLILVLILAIRSGIGKETSTKIIIFFYAICLLSVIGLGYFGGELVYGTKDQASGSTDGPVAQGAGVFKQNCSACHIPNSTSVKIGPGLKGVFAADTFPASGLPVSEDNLRMRLQKPFDKMPPFGHLPPEQVEALIAYLKTL